MGQTLIEKIAEKHVENPKNKVQSGDFVTIKPAHIMTHDNTGAVLKKFKSIGAAKVANPRQPVYALDHNVMDKSPENLAKYSKIEAFAKEMGVDFYPAGRGIGHQIMCEEGYAWPQTMMVASDSHSNTYGGLGCLGTPIVRTDAAAIWSVGKTWWQVPKISKVVLTGKMQPGVTGKDVIITLCGIFNNDEVLNHGIEFDGDGLKNLSIDERLAIANMTTEWGALVGLFPVDDVTIDWLTKRAAVIEKRGLENVPSDGDGKGKHPRVNIDKINELKNNIIKADSDAQYVQEITIDLGTVTPHVAGPGNLKVMNSTASIEDKHIKINKAYLVSCVNSRLSDLQAAAKVMENKKVHSNVDFYVAAASKEIEEQSKQDGSWDTLVKAGAKTLMSGCGPCIGLGEGLLEKNEVGISATNRNFKGRMGDKSAEVYLGSPAVVAASAIKGEICQPEDIKKVDQKPKTTIKATSEKSSTPPVDILPGFPEKTEGKIIFCHQDNLNTDGIYPGKYTYKDDMTPEDQAKVVMENYDSQFVTLAEKGDVVVGGFNFGTGSSREQAATAFKYKGITMVVAGSFSETYKRNAINNGFLVIEAPELTNDFKKKFGSERLTHKSDDLISIDFKTSTLVAFNKTYTISPTGAAAQELIIEGGLENWVKKKIS